MQVVDIDNERIQTKLVKQLLDTNEARHTKEASRALLIQMKLVEPPLVGVQSESESESARARKRANERKRETRRERRGAWQHGT